MTIILACPAFRDTPIFFIGSEKNMNKLALILVIIGAINWGCIGIFGVDIVAFFTGGQLSVVARIIYTLVGLAGLWSISFLFKDEKRLNPSTHHA